MKKQLKLSILDYGLLDEGKTPAQAWQDSVALAQLAEERGYHRFWLAEHHNVAALTLASPELLMTYIASQTQRIRLGSGGIMGLHYSPYKIAELAVGLGQLFPDRMDVGLGNSTGTPLVKKHLQSLYQPSQFGQWLERFRGYLLGQEEEINHLPKLDNLPHIFTLGMGGDSLSLSAELGLGYVYGSFPFIDHEPLALAGRLARTYRQDFQASSILEKPYFILAVFIVLAETSQQAEELAKSLDIWMLGKNDFNDFEAFPSLATYQSYQLTEEEQLRIAKQRKRMIVGSKAEVKEQLDVLLQACQPDELMMIPLVAGIDNRMQAVELLADLYGQ